jgi:hypothetical protein
MPASVDPPIRVAHALLGRTSQRLAPMHAETVKLANFLRRLLQSAVRLAHHIRTHHPEALDVNAMQATPRLGTRVAGGFSEVSERIGFTLTLLLARAPLLLATLLSHTIPFPCVH